MKITKIHLTNFKRFTELVIDNIPKTSKLVLLIGANGSGKSSLFDAFGFCHGAIKHDVATNEEFWKYFKKNETETLAVDINFSGDKKIALTDKNFNNEQDIRSHSFYGRTSFRQIPRIVRTSSGEVSGIDKDSDRPKYFIERDHRFENDVEKMAEEMFRSVFSTGLTGKEIAGKYIDPINLALRRIFDNKDETRLELIDIIPPIERKVAKINFRKGKSEVPYDHLSAGEKEIFNVLLNLHNRRSFYQDTIYFFDEIDLHLNTQLQFNFLKEITENWIPENSQLWTATHALGFIEYAKKTEIASIIDFDDANFDLPKVLTPEPKENPDIYEIAVGKEFMSSLFENMNIYFVENNDRDYYASIGLPKSVFIADNNRNNVYHKVRATDFFGIVDRDFLTDDDILQIRKEYPKLYVLNYYSIENYFYHPDNLEEYFQTQGKPFDKANYIKDLTEAKNQIKDTFIPSLMMKRTEYPYFGEPQHNGTAVQERFKNKLENELQSADLAANISSNDFETYYKSLPMKSYCTHLPQRNNISKTALVKTRWFKSKIEELLK